MRNPLVLCLSAALLGSLAAHATINIPSDGSDGVLNITQNTQIDLGEATEGAWDANNSANAGKGIYDPQKWAVVFKYSSVNIAAGATVTFKNHPKRAPVVWLVSGNASINGTLSLNGQDGQTSPRQAEPGPGGFRGGTAYYASLGASAGLGPGGGRRAESGFNAGAGGYSTAGTGIGNPGPYGNVSIVPLIGGSGGGGYHQSSAGGGGGGGGVILIACAGDLSIGGTLRAVGGAPGAGHTGAGSGGGIRLLCNTIMGAGVISAVGGSGGGGAGGGLGRIRIERVTNAGTLAVVPDPSVMALAAGATPTIWLPETGPASRIVSVGGVAAPPDPYAEFGAQGADVSLPQVTTTTVVVETTNAEANSVVTVRMTPKANGNFTETVATRQDPPISENPLVIRWIANVQVPSGYVAYQVKVVRP